MTYPYYTIKMRYGQCGEAEKSKKIKKTQKTPVEVLNFFLEYVTIKKTKKGEYNHG